MVKFHSLLLFIFSIYRFILFLSFLLSVSFSLSPSISLFISLFLRYQLSFSLKLNSLFCFHFFSFSAYADVPVKSTRRRTMEGKTTTEGARTPISIPTSTSAIASPSTPSDIYSVSTTSTNNSYTTAPLPSDGNKQIDSTVVNKAVVEKETLPVPTAMANNKGDYQIINMLLCPLHSFYFCRTIFNSLPARKHFFCLHSIHFSVFVYISSISLSPI